LGQAVEASKEVAACAYDSMVSNKNNLKSMKFKREQLPF
jgi:hypothetical protein